MKIILQRLQINPKFLGLIFFFAYLDSIRSRVSPGQLVDWYILTPESAVFSLIQALVIFFILQFSFSWLQLSPQVSIPWKKSMFSFGKGLIIFLLVSNAFTMALALAFGTWERNYQTYIQLSGNISRILDFVIYGGFYLALLLFQQFKSHQRQLKDYEVALAQSKITHLKQQLNPHFLFNNLNILDQLIEENPKSASAFLHNFSELYRYSLKNSDCQLVTWQEELEFAESYFQLIAEKFGKAYEMKITLDNPQGKLPPLTLQLLIENAVFHNYGTVENPVKINLTLGERLTVSNTRIPFKNPRHKGGKGLANLREQYRILSSKPIFVSEENGLFSVSIPFIP
ncbi:hypothetical protein SAMN04489724_0375 [Algoriphagus locisalis]|uniref:Signal transduction histidine kinase internal region domain-containing protein n=1 Tax=Algoriphagus locisalis TaxID=305507 RepID=A0A1I7EA98_9BACT|nr:histidine kinase [Algoriphagus locisalis]SFU20870.1 hypothetical protein SAMN04489724_0375 [Algoriphagus locisalis]